MLSLSHRDMEAPVAILAISTPAFTIFNNLHVEFTTSPEAKQLLEEPTTGIRGDRWHIIDGLVTHQGCVYVPPTSPSLPEILVAAHGLSHEGTEKTLH
jgi:hypothetical protein